MGHSRKYKGTVKHNGNHYFSGETVRGSQIEWRDERLWLYDDDDTDFGISNGFGTPRNEWVEIVI